MLTTLILVTLLAAVGSRVRWMACRLGLAEVPPREANAVVSALEAAINCGSFFTPQVRRLVREVIDVIEERIETYDTAQIRPIEFFDICAERMRRECISDQRSFLEELPTLARAIGGFLWSAEMKRERFRRAERFPRMESAA